MDLDAFTDHLRTVLLSLYDPTVLRNSPLVDALDVAGQANPGPALRRILLDTIESLRPDTHTPASSRNWRIYQVLRRRYIEQVSQRELAGDLSVSVRQLQREEKLARDVLAERLWDVYRLAGQDGQRPQLQAEATRPQVLSRTQELAEFRDSVPAQMVDVGEVIGDVLKTIEPLLQLSGATVHYAAAKDLPRVWLQTPLLRQALLNLVGMAARYGPEQEIRLRTEVLDRQVAIALSTPIPRRAPPLQAPEQLQEYRMIRRLIALCEGTLSVSAAGGEPGRFAAQVALPAAPEVPVLVIDDNADTRLLFERYLSGWQYRFAGAANGQDGLALAMELDPAIIVLDVMMSGSDGWTLLSQLREHPRTAHIPVVICTILAHRELAIALGAVEFLRKPVNRATFLAALDRQLARPARESG